MKKLLSLLCIAVMLFGLTACAANPKPELQSTQTESVTEAVSETVSDTAKPKLDIKNITSFELIKYFQSQGILTTGDGYTLTVQDHENYWSSTPVRECIVWHDNAESKVGLSILILDSSMKDSSKKAYKKWLKEIWITKSLPAEFFSFGYIDHLAGNIAFSYSHDTADEAELQKIENAYSQFVKDSGVTPKF